LTGRCRPFEEEADGTVPSDAVVAVVLKRTADAVSDRDGAYALVVGAAYNSDGATNKVGYQVPSPNGQSDAIAAAWKNSQMSPDQLQYIELHGSGTQIGDALELEAIRKSLQKIGYSRKECLVGSNKGTLGNTQHASGLTSLIKICKSIQTGTIPAMIRTGKLNSFITDANLSLNFAYEPTKVQPNALIGVSAAGWGGVNSHVVVQVPPAELIKKMNKKQPKYTLCNETLAAPRRSDRSELNGSDAAILQVKKVPANGQIHPDPAPRKPGIETAISLFHGNDPALHLVMQEVNKLLDHGHVIDAETDLRAAGFDSTRFVSLSHAIKKLSKGFHLP
jgi:acyl transferase domain-containing protein